MEKKKKKSSFVNVAKAHFLWGISGAGEVTPCWSCAEEAAAPHPCGARREQPLSPTPGLWAARGPPVNGGRRQLVTPLPLLFSAAHRPTPLLAPPAALLTTQPLVTVSYTA